MALIFQNRKNKRMENNLAKDQTILEIKDHCRLCPRCKTALQTIEIHGHLQCIVCKSVVEDCCQGSPSK